MTTKLNTPRLRFAGFHEEWERRKLGEITTFSNERINSSMLSCENYVTTENMLPNAQGVAQAASVPGNVNVIQYKKGDILLSNIRPYLKKVWQADKDGGCSADVIVFKVLSDCSSDFIRHIIDSQSFINYAMSGVKGVKMPRGDREQMKLYEFGAPTLPEQQKIGAFFSSLDAEISREQERVEKLRQLKAACLQDMFPREGENAPRVRFDGCSGEWERRKLGDVAEKPFKYGLNAAAKDYDGHNKYLRITDIDDELRTFDYNNLSSPNAVELTNDYLLQECDIVFARTGASVGKTYLYDKKDGKVFYAGFLIRARIKSGYCPYFIFTSTLLHSYQQYIRITSQRSGQPGVNAKEYEQYSFLTPTLPEQQKIGAFFSSLDAEISREQERVEKLRQLKAACLGQMFVGG